MGRAVASKEVRAIRALAVFVAGVVAVGALLVGGHEADAKAAKVTTVKAADGTMSWSVSPYVMGANPAAPSLAEVRSAEPPTTYAAATGWEFNDGTGTYDPKTGAMTVAFPGALEFGNTSFGNYGFKYANPTLTLDAAGAGTLAADVSVRPPGGAPFGTATKTVLLDVTGATPTATKKKVEVEVTPSAFAAPLLTAAGDLSPFFKPTGSTSDSFKTPASFTVAFDVKPKKPSKN